MLVDAASSIPPLQDAHQGVLLEADSEHASVAPNEEEVDVTKTKEMPDMNLVRSQTQHTDATMNAELSSSSSSSLASSDTAASPTCVSGILQLDKASTKNVYEPCGAPNLYYYKQTKQAWWRRQSIQALIAVSAVLLGAATIGALLAVVVLKARHHMHPTKSCGAVACNVDETTNVGSGNSNETTTDMGSGNNNETIIDLSSGNNNETIMDLGSGNESIVDANDTANVGGNVLINNDGITHCVSIETANNSWNAILQGSSRNLTSGPMVGHTTPDTAIIWAYGGPNATVGVLYQRLGDCPGQVEMVDMPLDKMTLELNGLKADTRYRYHVMVHGTNAGQMGTFTTVPRQVKKFWYMFGSCISFKRDPIQTIWDEVLDQDPKFLILNGDTVYSNTVNYTTHWSYHMEQWQIEPFANIICQRPTYTMWDDHDYGPNNSDGTKSGKENSLQAFKDVFANPTYGTPELPGIFTTFHYGDDVR